MPVRAQPRPFDLAALAGRIASPDARRLVAERLGITHRQLYRLAASGLTLDQADRLAVRAGLHPGEVWPSWWVLDDTEVDDLDDNERRAA